MDRYKTYIVILAACSMLLASGCTGGQADSQAESEVPNIVQTAAPEVKLSIKSTDVPKDTVLSTPEAAEEPSFAQLVDTYGDLGLIDAHNHDASAMQYLRMEKSWTANKVRNVVLFGDVSEPSAILTDVFSWAAYQSNPDLYIPYFSGFDLHDPECLKVIKNNLEKGYFGLGEIAAASSYSPVLANVAWKASDPMDGYFPQIYDLIAEYKAPILLHIDPPSGQPVAKLEQALSEHPDTIFIFAHINAYNTPDEVDRLMGKYPNLYADFFAGYSVYNPEGGLRPERFIPVIKKYPDRFMLSTDSGYGLEGGEEKAIEAMYRMLDLLDDAQIAQMIARDNLLNLIQAQPATETQLKAIAELERNTGNSYGEKLNKLEAGKILAQVIKK
ncbi:amidohydrolase family protein [Paenibacillus sp. FSL R7-0345]|uniref:amidohydrolase family protein n=1 Tax=Paenibacillus sp. FSL R7-0345 TaxID=2954535 RepID=UPI00315A8F17